MIYFDYAAATPVDPRVAAAMQPYFGEKFYNPSAAYLPARHVSDDLKKAREKVARRLGVKHSEIVFTAGGTEANNLAVQGVLQSPALSELNSFVMLTSGIEHDSVLEPSKLFNSLVALTTEQGLVDMSDLVRKITDRTVLVSVMLANNELGTIQPIRQISQMIESIKAERTKKGNNTPLYFHTDACQAANYLDLHVSRLGVDMMTLNGGKIYGPKQSGVLYVASHVRLTPLIHGGGQEKGLRSGTENVAAAIGFAEALDIAQNMRVEESKRLNELQNVFFHLCKKKIPKAIINGSTKSRLPNNIHLTLPGEDNERLMLELERIGYLVATGSACSASSQKPSHVLSAMGITDADARSSLRITMGRDTSQNDVEGLVDALVELIG